MDKAEIRKAIRDIDAERKRLNKRRGFLEQLLATYEDPNGTQPSVRRYPNKRRSQTEWMSKVVDFLRTHPNQDWDAGSIIREGLGIPHSSLRTAMRNIEKENLATVVKKTPSPHGSPILRYKPTKVRPGEGIVGDK